MALSGMLALALGISAFGPGEGAPLPLPSPVYCAALFSITLEELENKSGDADMTRGFREDAAALRQIVVAQMGGARGQVAADAAIGKEKTRLKAEMQARKPDDPVIDLKSCYRVKALGPRGE